MAERTPIALPLFQRFDCHSCGYCCRSLVVNVRPAERQRILDDGWSERLPDQPLFERYRFRGRVLYRLAHRPEGGCVFLADDGRCRLHAETGFTSKPLACRLYPFVPSPGVDRVRLDLRADCPSVAANEGRSLTAHQAAISDLADEVGATPAAAPPAWRGAREITVREFKAVVGTFDGLLRKGSLPHRARWRAGSYLLDLLYEATIRKVRDERFEELLTLLAGAALEQPGTVEPPLGSSPPRRAGKLFRQWLFLHAVTDDPAHLGAGLLARTIHSWRRYGQARRFARAAGPIPPMGDDWPETTFEAVAAVKPGADEVLEPVTRSLRVKLEAHAFAGPAYFRYDLLSGLTALWLLPAVAGWFARLAAVGAGHDTLTPDDVLAGLRRTHHTFGVSPVFARISERLRFQALTRPGLPGLLLAAYGP